MTWTTYTLHWPLFELAGEDFVALFLLHELLARSAESEDGYLDFRASSLAEELALPTSLRVVAGHMSDFQARGWVEKERQSNHYVYWIDYEAIAEEFEDPELAREMLLSVPLRERKGDYRGMERATSTGGRSGPLTESTTATMAAFRGEPNPDLAPDPNPAPNSDLPPVVPPLPEGVIRVPEDLTGFYIEIPTPKKEFYSYEDYQFDRETWQAARHGHGLPEKESRLTLLLGAYLLGLYAQHGLKTQLSASEFGRLLRRAKECIEFFTAQNDGDDVAGFQEALDLVSWFVKADEDSFIAESGYSLELLLSLPTYRKYSLRGTSRRQSGQHDRWIRRNDSAGVTRGEDRTSREAVRF